MSYTKLLVVIVVVVLVKLRKIDPIKEETINVLHFIDYDNMKNLGLKTMLDAISEQITTRKWQYDRLLK